MSVKPTREEALALFLKYNAGEPLLKHALSVEGVMRHFARKLGEDEEKWGVIGLLHDVDYERYPDEHCKKAESLLAEAGIPEEYIHGVVSHGYGICTEVAPEHIMEKVLYTIDELTGLITAAAIMRPSKSVMDLELKSVMKKYKAANFAAGVNREVIERGCAMLGMELQEVVTETILGMREVADAIGLGGI
ncbi:MAG: HDIG domain-containing protein [Clostridiales bacterium]|nr:HDIG domain-containing protein [Clostridiales bacterium]